MNTQRQSSRRVYSSFAKTTDIKELLEASGVATMEPLHTETVLTNDVHTSKQQTFYCVIQAQNNNNQAVPHQQPTTTTPLLPVALGAAAPAPIQAL